MSPKPTSRRALIQALERAPDIEQATRIARDMALARGAVSLAKFGA